MSQFSAWRSHLTRFICPFWCWKKQKGSVTVIVWQELNFADTHGEELGWQFVGVPFSALNGQFRAGHCAFLVDFRTVDHPESWSFLPRIEDDKLKVGQLFNQATSYAAPARF